VMSHSTPLMGIVPVDFQAVGSLALPRSVVGGEVRYQGCSRSWKRLRLNAG